MNSNIIISFSGDDILLPKLLRRYITEAKKLPVYSSAVKLAEEVLENIESKNDIAAVPISFVETFSTSVKKEYHIS